MPFLDANYKRIHYVDCLPAHDKSPRQTFIFVHGLGSSQNYWFGLIPSLIAQNCRCVALDTSGSGRSKYTGVEQSIHALATDIIDCMDILKISKAVVVGHSMAGITVPHLAATWPDRVSAIVLLGPVLPSTEAAPTFEKRIEAVEKSGMQPMADTIPYAAVGSSASSLHHAFIRELLLAQDPAGYVSLCRVIVNAATAPPEYHKIHCPALIVAGDEDKSAPVAGCQKILDSLGSSQKRMAVMKGIGHWMAVEAPEDVAKEITSFFRQAQ